MESNLTNSILDAMVINTHEFYTFTHLVNGLARENANNKQIDGTTEREKNRELIKTSRLAGWLCRCNVVICETDRCKCS